MGLDRRLGSGMKTWIFIFWAAAGLSLRAEYKVRVWEEPLSIPTYIVKAAEKNPIFYDGRAYQGAQGTVYPYPFLDGLTDIRKDKVYRACYLENEYIKICVLPEIGGRIFSAVDKTNGYDFFYRQHVIKPALIGMLGAWISGGVEWNFPHHHRATGFMEIDHTLTRNPDGSATIWVGEMELRHRMRWSVGLTLYPGKSYLEVRVRLVNRTPYAHSFLFWTNASVHAGNEYQVIFPPDTELATYHGKTQFSRWPVSTEVFRGVDYSRGVDISRYKNHTASLSFFAWGSRGNFLAGYDHRSEAGVVHVADPYIVPGKKFWTWGTGARGEMWEKILTETDGPYLELMVGAYSDNQPDYTWLHPYEEKRFSQYWFPVREMKGIKAANRKAALYGEALPGNKYFVCVNTTSPVSGAAVRLVSEGRVLAEEKVSVSPRKPFRKEFELSDDLREDRVCVQLLSPDKNLILEYQPVSRVDPDLPPPAETPSPPGEIGTVEELYLTGLRLEQFFNPVLDPYPYYQEALRRSPNDYRVNTALGRLYLQRGMAGKAEACLSRAVSRITWNYTHPKDAEALYYAGLVHRKKGNLKEAFDAFQEAAWDQAWAAASYYQAAEIASSRKNFESALQLCRRSIGASGNRGSPLVLEAALLRHLGFAGEARKKAEKVLKEDPLNFRAGYELCRAAGAEKTEEGRRLLDLLIERMRDNPQSYLELACDYTGCGLWEEAGHVLSLAAGGEIKETVRHPLIYYYLGAVMEKMGYEQKALHYYGLGAEISPDYCFPFRLESWDILSRARRHNPDDARAAYYIGNLLYERQPEKAVEAWETSASDDPGYSVVHRNLALAYARMPNELTRAVAAMERAVACAPDDPRLYYERDLLYEAAGLPAEKRLDALLENHHVVRERDDALSREVGLLVRMGRYRQALEILKKHHFHIWEGGGRIHSIYVDAHLLYGVSLFGQGNVSRAQSHFQSALEYPENLEVGRPRHGGREAQVCCFLAEAAEVLGNPEKRVKFLEKAASYDRGWSELSYYKASALMKLGRREEAADIFEGLLDFARGELDAAPARDFFEKFGERLSEKKRRAQWEYLCGLALLGKGEKAEARKKFRNCMELDPNHLWAPVYYSDNSHSP